jgi:hypothetical protein
MEISDDNKSERILLILLVSVILCFGHFLFNKYGPTPNMLYTSEGQIDFKTLEGIIDYHSREPAFARRPIATFCMKAMATGFNLHLAEAFILSNYIFLFLASCALAFCSRKMHASTWQTIINLLFFHLTYGVLFLFMGEVCGYDDFLQFAFCFLALALWWQKKYLPFIFVAAVACLARESTLLLFPSLLLLHTENFNFKSVQKPLIVLIIAVALYAVALYVAVVAIPIPDAFAKDLQRGGHYGTNMSTPARIFNARYGLMLSAMLPLLLLWKNNLSALKSIKRAYYVCLIINTIIVWRYTYTSETRLFCLPLIFFWPLAGQALQLLQLSFPSFQNNLKILLLKLLAMLLIIIAVCLAPNVQVTPINPTVHQVYLLLHVSFTTIVGLFTTKKL